MTLTIYSFILETIRQFVPIINAIAEHDRSLADQLRRALANRAQLRRRRGQPTRQPSLSIRDRMRLGEREPLRVRNGRCTRLHRGR